MTLALQQISCSENFHLHSSFFSSSLASGKKLRRNALRCVCARSHVHQHLLAQDSGAPPCSLARCMAGLEVYPTGDTGASIPLDAGTTAIITGVQYCRVRGGTSVLFVNQKKTKKSKSPQEGLVVLVRTFGPNFDKVFFKTCWKNQLYHHTKKHPNVLCTVKTGYATT